MNFCTKCGTKVIEGTKFCQSCGTPVEQAQVSPNSTTANPTVANPTTNLSNPKSNKNPIILGAVALVAVLLLVFIVKGVFGYPSSPQKVAKAFVETLCMEGDLKGAKKYLASDLKADFDEVEDFAEGWEALEEMGVKFKDIKVVDSEKDGKEAVVTIEMKISFFGESEKQEIEISLIKEKGKWRVSDMY